MKKIKITAIIALTLMLAFAVAGCGQSQGNDEATETEQTTTAQTESGEAEPTDAPEASGGETGDVIAETYIGNYQDETSQRASLSIYEAKGALYADIYWSSSAESNTTWTMPCTFDEKSGSLVYKDGVKTENVADEEGNMEGEEVYTDGTGTFTYKDGAVYWKDNKEDAGKDCVFRVVNGADDEEE